jgi:tRNA-splicing ligase RtcB
MRVSGLVYADRNLWKDIAKDQSLQQVANVAQLPGIVGRSLAMPDIHWGYGFPIGGVAAFDIDDGVISPGGVGYDINCGCRIMATTLNAGEIKPLMKEIIDGLYNDIPTGVGKAGPVRLKKPELKKVLTKGAAWAVSQGYGTNSDLDHAESQGAMAGADPDALSERALERGAPQLGTLGSGNHFLEIDVVEDVLDDDTAQAFGLFQGQIVMSIHSGSRGLGHQVCDDFLKVMAKAAQKEHIALPDRQLVCASVQSEPGRRYFGAMAAAANYAWANRQIIMHFARESILKTLGARPRDLNMPLVYDVAHNIAKIETHVVDGKSRKVCVHRKGATRAFPAGHPELPDIYAKTGQPVLIPGDMGRASYVLAGEPGAMEETFGSCCHGAGRVLSRSQAKKKAKGRALHRELEDQGIVVRATGRTTLAEEMPEAYKDVSQVVDVVHQAGLARKVVRLRPLGVIKG